MDCFLGNQNIFEYVTTSEIQILKNAFLENEELKKLFEKYPNAETAIEELSSEKLNEVVLVEVDNFINFYSECYEQLFRSEEKASNIGKEAGRELKAITEITIRLVEDKRCESDFRAMTIGMPLREWLGILVVNGGSE